MREIEVQGLETQLTRLKQLIENYVTSNIMSVKDINKGYTYHNSENPDRRITLQADIARLNSDLLKVDIIAIQNIRIRIGKKIEFDIRLERTESLKHIYYKERRYCVMRKLEDLRKPPISTNVFTPEERIKILNFLETIIINYTEYLKNSPIARHAKNKNRKKSRIDFALEVINTYDEEVLEQEITLELNKAENLKKE